MMLIVGVLPEPPFGSINGFFTVEGGVLHDDKGERGDRFEKVFQLQRLWKSNPMNPDRADPMAFIAWATQKNIDIYWLPTAQKYGYLKHFAGRIETSSAERPLQRSAAQDKAILNHIIRLGHSPSQLPKNPSGKGGVKAQVRADLVGRHQCFPLVGKQFDHAWERLRKNGEIADKG